MSNSRSKQFKLAHNLGVNAVEPTKEFETINKLGLRDNLFDLIDLVDVGEKNLNNLNKNII